MFDLQSTTDKQQPTSAGNSNTAALSIFAVKKFRDIYTANNNETTADGSGGGGAGGDVIRCACGIDREKGTMIQCERCNVSYLGNFFV